MELAHYNIIFYEDMVKKDLGLDDAVSCEWKGVDFPLGSLIISIFSTRSSASGGGGSSLT